MHICSGWRGHARLIRQNCRRDKKDETERRDQLERKMTGSTVHLCAPFISLLLCPSISRDSGTDAQTKPIVHVTIDLQRMLQRRGRNSGNLGSSFHRCSVRLVEYRTTVNMNEIMFVHLQWADKDAKRPVAAARPHTSKLFFWEHSSSLTRWVFLLTVTDGALGKHIYASVCSPSLHADHQFPVSIF